MNLVATVAERHEEPSLDRRQLDVVSPDEDSFRFAFDAQTADYDGAFAGPPDRVVERADARDEVACLTSISFSP